MSGPRVGIMSPGDMGGATGAALRRGGLEVFTCLAGRSALTRKIANEAGFTDCDSLDVLVQRVDLLLSIVVPSNASEVAAAVSHAIERTGAGLTYVECNAIAPQTVLEIERIVAGTGAGFIDAGIIGGPPQPGARTTFYASGPDTAAFEALRGHGIEVTVVGPRIGQASGLKMVYAASTKGTTALWTELLVAAKAMGLDEALGQAFGPDHPIASRVLRGIPGMPHRAGRWVGEMEEIAATFAALGMTPKMLEGAAAMYSFVDSSPLGELTSRSAFPSLERVIRSAQYRSGSGAGRVADQLGLSATAPLAPGPPGEGDAVTADSAAAGIPFPETVVRPA